MICSDNFDNHMGEGRQLIATNVVNKGVDIFTFCTFFFLSITLNNRFRHESQKISSYQLKHLKF